MSTRNTSPSVGGTLAGGIQDVSAILPLIGTEQCEKHVGSALTGGYLYSAAAPLSIFGSLGIVKAGISILISSISISVPQISVSFQDFKPSAKYLGKKKWLGGRMLKDAGFDLAGTVAPLIGMDGNQFKAEKRLIQILEEKHIDDPEKISVRWKSRQWNIMLVLSTILAAAFSITPYFALLLGSASWRPKDVHLPWLYPILRIVGSCGAAVTSQLIIQFRVISLMKNRIILMILQKRLDTEYKERFDAWLKDPNFQWDPNLPAEQSIWSIEQYPLSSDPLIPPTDNSRHKDQITIKMDVPLTLDGTPQAAAHHLIKMTPARSPLSDLHELQREFFPSSTRDTTLTLLLWIILGLSLPVTVAGYIGCFTLIGATPSNSNGPLVWVGLEAALSILRVFMWAFNPKFDEQTEITVELKLSEHQPMVTTNEYNPYIPDFEELKPFTLVPEDEFLARITPYTGPLDQYQTAYNISLYFTLVTEYNTSVNWSLESEPVFMRLFMTVFDFNMQVAVTLVSSEMSFCYYDVAVKYNMISRALEASVQSEKRVAHPWRIEDDHLFHSLEMYYCTVVSALHQRDTNTLTAILPRKWDLSPHAELKGQSINNGHLSLPILTPENELYLHQGYEHHLKSSLVATWSDWIVTDMDNLRAKTWLDCHEWLNDRTSQKAKWELTELDVQLVWEWLEREAVVCMLSFKLEDILHEKMEVCISQITRARGEERLGVWMRSEFDIGCRKRLVEEREAAKKRLGNAMEEWSQQAHRHEAMEFIDQQWLAASNGLSEGLKPAVIEFIGLHEKSRRVFFQNDRLNMADQLKKHLSHWRAQHQIEEEMMKSAVERVRCLPASSKRDELDAAYTYPEPDDFATAKFAVLSDSSSKGKACSAMVYDVSKCNKEEEVCNVIAKNTTRSVVNVDPKIAAFIPPNKHLLFLSYKDGMGLELPFVQQNRDRWWSQQTTNSATFYFTPQGIPSSLDFCYCEKTQTIANILVYLTVRSTVCVRVVQMGNATQVSLRENGAEVVCISAISTKFQLSDFQAFGLEPGAHELELVPQINQDCRYGFYYLYDILIELKSDKPPDNSAPTETKAGVLAITDDEN